MLTMGTQGRGLCADHGGLRGWGCMLTTGDTGMGLRADHGGHRGWGCVLTMGDTGMGLQADHRQQVITLSARAAVGTAIKLHCRCRNITESCTPGAEVYAVCSSQKPQSPQ